MGIRVKLGKPRNLNRRHVEHLLRKTQGVTSVGKRIDILSQSLLGLPYTPNPLIGSASSKEIFTVSLDGFDCVTYIETVLALSLAAGARDFDRWVRRIRYDGGRVRWNLRNHYMTTWLRNNRRQGIIGFVSIPGVTPVIRDRTLSAIPELPPHRVRMKFIPKRAMRRAMPHLRRGDLVAFVSTRKGLDVFHAGILAGSGTPAMIRHASRSAGSVIEQKFADFLKANRMAGVIVARPRDIRMSVAARN